MLFIFTGFPNIKYSLKTMRSSYTSKSVVTKEGKFSATSQLPIFKKKIQKKNILTQKTKNCMIFGVV